MSVNDRLDELEKEIEALKAWKANCNMLMAGWGGVCMAIFTAGGIIANYYQNIKSYLMALWAVK